MTRRLLQIDEEMRACRAELRGMWGERTPLRSAAGDNAGKVVATIDGLNNGMAAMDAPDSLMVFVKTLLVYVLSKARKLEFENDSLTTASRATADGIVNELKMLLLIVPMAFSSLSGIATQIIAEADKYLRSKDDNTAGRLLGLFHEIGKVLKTDANYTAAVLSTRKEFLKAVGTLLQSPG